MKLPRWAHHLYACITKTSWNKCSICGKYFGSHEGGHSVSQRRRNELSLTGFSVDEWWICPDCEKK